MIIINVLKDFGDDIGFRTYEDGPNSGQEFFDKLLNPRFKEAINSNCKLKIEMNGVEGYLSSFLNEAFRRLGKEYGPDTVWNRLIIEYDESPRVIEKIKKGIYEPTNVN